MISIVRVVALYDILEEKKIHGSNFIIPIHRSLESFHSASIMDISIELLSTPSDHNDGQPSLPPPPPYLTLFKADSYQAFST